ncbi:MAG: acyltransferase [Clostridiales bacterium]|nr:acyltransferase [Clostridiales bacterium]
MGKRNYFLDFWKFIAAIGVIIVHVPFNNIAGTLGTAVGTWGLGLFALISGYACYGGKDLMCGKVIRRLKRNGIITAISVAAYLVFSYFIYRGDGMKAAWVYQFKKPMTYVNMIFVGDLEFFYGSALWYIIGLLWCYVIFYILLKINRKKVFYILLPVFLILRIVVDTYVNSYGANWHYSGNALVGVLPMMLLGYVIADKKDTLMKIPTWVLILSAVVSASAMFLSVCYDVAGLNISQVFKIICATFVFLIGIKKPDWYVIKPLAFLGREDSLYIYLCHFMIYVGLATYMYSKMVPERIIEKQLTFAVIIGSVIVARLISLIIYFIKLPFAKKNASMQKS